MYWFDDALSSPAAGISFSNNKMCRRFSLLANIEKATIDDFKPFIKGLFRGYIILLILSIVSVLFSLRAEVGILVFDILGVVLYACCALLFYITSNNVIIDNCLYSISATSLLLLLKVASLIYAIVLASYTSLASAVISSIIQASTVYIFVKLRSKILSTAASAPPESRLSEATTENKLWVGAFTP